jgi:hypothetical protein
LIVIATLCAGELLFVADALEDGKAGLGEPIGQALWACNRLAIIMLGLRWSRALPPLGFRTLMTVGLTTFLIVVCSVFLATLPLAEEGNFGLAILSLLGGFSLGAVILAAVSLQRDSQAWGRRWLLGGLGLYLLVEQILYSLESTPWTEVFYPLELGYFGAYLSLIQSAAMPWASPETD